MKINIVTLFPKQFMPFLETSIVGRAVKQHKVEFNLIDLRQFGEGKHQIVDDRPFGGGPGMILKADILAKAVKSLPYKPYTLLMSASGKPYNQQLAQQFSQLPELLIIAGHYEGVDQRFVDKYVNEEISIGDYVLTGGEIPTMVIADSIVRLIPGVLKKAEATEQESFSHNLLEYPQYTRPENFEGAKVPPVLLSGHHQQIKQWQKQQSEEKTTHLRPDLLTKNH
ncbi:tRNA (guanosine(37)-N1)-methyltransferase TrmD [Patescibacteria group bacterium]|nr:tRNA (guanosine(37)-N1)-methyltransferase TrmD [Patescibacteria group bacterium]MCL5409947.1 tRNA (guanosine(37)-N1)-methyltransferase TrmD [Patescibacteria group bacterium]